MPMPVKKLDLPDADRARLEAVVAKRTSPAREYLRAKVLLLKAGGMANETICGKLDVSMPLVRRAISRFE